MFKSSILIFQNSQKENILSFYSKIMQTSESADECHKTNVISNNNNNNDDSTDDSFGMEPLFIENDTPKCDDGILQNKVPLVNGTTEADVTETGIFRVLLRRSRVLG